MPHQSPKKHWLLGTRMVWIYNDDEKAILYLNRKIGMNLLIMGKEVPVVSSDNNGELTNCRFYYRLSEYRITIGLFTIYVFKYNSMNEEKMIGMIPRAANYKAKGEMLYQTILHAHVG